MPRPRQDLTVGTSSEGWRMKEPGFCRSPAPSLLSLLQLPDRCCLPLSQFSLSSGPGAALTPSPGLILQASGVGLSAAGVGSQIGFL